MNFSATFAEILVEFFSGLISIADLDAREEQIKLMDVENDEDFETYMLSWAAISELVIEKLGDSAFDIEYSLMYIANVYVANCECEKCTINAVNENRNDIAFVFDHNSYAIDIFVHDKSVFSLNYEKVEQLRRMVDYHLRVNNERDETDVVLNIVIYHCILKTFQEFYNFGRYEDFIKIFDCNADSFTILFLRAILHTNLLKNVN